MKELIRSPLFDYWTFVYWNFKVTLNGLELWHELTGEEFVIDGGYIVALGKEE